MIRGLLILLISVPAWPWNVPEKFSLERGEPCPLRIATADWYAVLGELHIQSHSVIWNTLVDSVKTSGFSRPSNRPIRILNLASAQGKESYTLSAFFGTGIFGAPSPNAPVIALDFNEHAIAAARADQAELGDKAKDVQFLSGDASAVQTLGDLGPFDVVWMRHPNITDDFTSGRWTWTNIFKNAAACLRPGGLLVVTYYTQYEAEMAAGVFAQNREVDLDLKHFSNPNLARTADEPYFAPDNQVTVGIRQD